MRSFCVRALVPIALTLVVLGDCRADVMFNLTPAMLNAAPGGTVEFTGTLTNAGAVDVFLNGDLSVFPYLTLTLDDSPFFANAPLSLSADGGEYSGPLFDVTISPVALPGPYSGSFIIQGGSDSNTFDTLASQDFQVTVNTSSPEPNTLFLVTIALTGVFLARRRAEAGCR